MGRAMSIAELRRLSDSDLIAQHDSVAQTTEVGVAYYLNEMMRRDSARREALLLRLTWAIFLLTAVNVAAVIISLAG